MGEKEIEQSSEGLGRGDGSVGAGGNAWIVLGISSAFAWDHKRKIKLFADSKRSAGSDST